MKMDDKALVAAIEQHEGASSLHGLLQDERIEAIDRYLGKPIGNEVDGRSQVVARDSFDTVEWLKPQLADIFTSGEEIVSFSPRSAEDVKAAEQETDYINHLITQRNNWFEIWYAWTHDALVQKVGYVKVYWDDSEDKTREKYQNLDPDQYARLSQDDGIEFISKQPTPIQGPQGFVLDQMGQPLMQWTCEIERTKPRDVVIIDNVPPENVRVDQNARGLSLQDRRVAFVEHSEMMTITSLREDGLDVPDDINDGGSSDNDWENDQRNDYSPFRDTDGEESDPSMRRVRCREVWIRCDFDGDGRAELRHVIVVGTTILLNEDCDVVPIVALCPIPQPHQHTGLSIIDAVMDLEKIQTALLRGGLDNQYLANNGRYGINENNVNLDDMLDSRAGGLVRVNGAPGESIFPLTHPTTGTQTVPMMEYIDRLKERRTGISEQTQGLNPQALNNQAGAGANAALLSASQQRIKFIARIFAETGVKTLFQIVHQITLQNSRQQQIVELRGEWVPVDPRQWTKRTDLVISVALGAGDRVQQLAYLSQQRMMQLEMVPMGIASPQNLYNTVNRMTKAAGYKDATEFWTDPAKNPPPPPQPPLEIQLEQMKQQGAAQLKQLEQGNDAQKFQAEMQLKGQAEIMQAQAKQQETQMQLELQAANDERDQQRQAEKDARDHELALMQMQNDRDLAEAKIASDERKAQLQADVQLRTAEMSRMTSIETASMSAQTTRDTAALSADTAMKTTVEGKKPPKPDSSLMDAVTKLNERFDGIEGHMTAPRKKVRDASGKLTGVEINGKIIPIED